MKAVLRFWEDEDGSPTVEFVLWMPIFVLVLALIVNATLLLHEQSRAWDLARDGARQRAVGVFTTDLAAETDLKSRLPNHPTYDARIFTDPATNLVIAEVSVDPSDVILFGKTTVGAILGQGYRLKSKVYMRREF